MFYICICLSGINIKHLYFSFLSKSNTLRLDFEVMGNAAPTTSGTGANIGAHKKSKDKAGSINAKFDTSLKTGVLNIANSVRNNSLASEVNPRSVYT